MALIVSKEYNGKTIINTVRIGVVERIKATSLRYTVGFYKDMELRDLKEDIKVDIKQLYYKITGKKGKILKAGYLLPFSRNAEYTTELKKMKKPMLKNKN